jgi:hypothetical protein
MFCLICAKKLGFSEQIRALLDVATEKQEFFSRTVNSGNFVRVWTQNNFFLKIVWVCYEFLKISGFVSSKC